MVRLILSVLSVAKFSSNLKSRISRYGFFIVGLFVRFIRSFLALLFALRGEVRGRGRPGSRSLFLSRQEK
jgi:hypothetical protein